MKAVKILMLIALATVSLVSCKKDDAQKQFVFEGMWEGKLGTGTEIPDAQFAINLKVNGEIERINGAGNVGGTGIWSLINNEFAASYETISGVKIFLTGDFNPETKALTGTWSNSGGNSGKWNATHE